MNKPLFAAATIIVATTAIATGLVGDTDSCGEVIGWTVPFAIMLSMAVPAVLSFFGGRSHRAHDNDLRAKLIEMRDAFDAPIPSTVGSTFQLASHYYNLVIAARPALQAVIEKLAK